MRSWFSVSTVVGLVRDHALSVRAEQHCVWGSKGQRQLECAYCQPGKRPRPHKMSWAYLEVPLEGLRLAHPHTCLCSICVLLDPSP